MNPNLKIIGTSHISKLSVSKINTTFKEFNPDIIAVELDVKRFHSIFSNQNKQNSKQKSSMSLSLIPKIGVTGFFFLIIGRFIQKKLGSIVGMEPGSDMIQGIKLAKTNDKLLALIDQDIQITLRNFSRKFSFKEKLRLFKDLFMGLVFKKGPKIKFDLNKIPSQDLISTLITQVKDSYPGLYSALIDDRDKFMAKKLFHLINKNPDKKIMVIIGAGHEAGMKKYFKKLEQSNLSLK